MTQKQKKEEAKFHKTKYSGCILLKSLEIHQNYATYRSKTGNVTVSNAVKQ